MIKIAIVAGVNNDLDEVRGVGVHNSELFKAIDLLKIKNFKFISDPKLADVTHYTKFHPFFISLPFIKPSKKVVLTIHDLTPLIYPKVYKSGVRGKINFLINKLLIWKNVDRIITISETSKKDICRFLGVKPEIIDIIYLAPKSTIHKLKIKNLKLKISKRFNLPNRFVLYTGDVNYNKNISRLVEACEIAKIPLVIAGKQAKEIKENKIGFKVLLGPVDYLRSFFGRLHPEIVHYDFLKKELNKNSVSCLGFVSDEELNNLYSLAYCYVQPSLYEGFGLPALEAVVCGTPLVVTKTQALVEILGDKLDYVNSKDPKDIAKGILNSNKKVRLPREYSWKKTAKETLEVYAKA